MSKLKLNRLPDGKINPQNPFKGSNEFLEQIRKSAYLVLEYLNPKFEVEIGTSHIHSNIVNDNYWAVDFKITLLGLTDRENCVVTIYLDEPLNAEKYSLEVIKRGNLYYKICIESITTELEKPMQLLNALDSQFKRKVRKK